MNSLLRSTRLPRLIIRGYSSSSPSSKSIEYSSPDRYNVPIRPPTMDDLMEPHGLWKEAYAKEKAKANMHLLKGILCFSATCMFFYHSGVMDQLFMPNLDNLMEDTVPFEFDKEGRVTV